MNSYCVCVIVLYWQLYFNFKNGDQILLKLDIKLDIKWIKIKIIIKLAIKLFTANIMNSI
jgi:hypothetical protein